MGKLNNKRHFKHLIMALLTIGFVTGCSPSLSKTTPIYQGMSIERGSSYRSYLNGQDYFNEADDPQYEDEVDEELDEDFVKEEELNNDIKDIVDIDIETTEEVSYYVQKSENFLLALNIYNPSQYEIISFTINGYKYANNMFARGSTLSKVMIEVTAQDQSGYFNYEVDAIKYIDGTDIKDVRMDGEKVIKTAIRFDNTPTATVTKQNIQSRSANFEVKVVDHDSRITSNDVLKFFLSDGDQIIFEEALVKGNNSIEITELEVNKKYEYAIVSTFDMLDGQGSSLRYLQVNSFTTLAGIVFRNVVATKEDISFNLDYIDKDATVSSLSLYNADTLKLMHTIAANETSFKGLYSDFSYYLVANYSYPNNGKTFTDKEVVLIKTGTKAVPVVNIFDIRSEQKQISFNIDVTDADKVGELSSIELYSGQTLVDSHELIQGEESKNYSFDGLLSNSEYSIKVVYTYNLNDGNGNQNIVLNESYPTLSEKITVKEITVLNNTNPKVGEEVHVRIALDNPSKVLVRSFFINGQEIDVVISKVTDSAIIKFIPENFSGGIYAVKIDSLTYTSFGKIVKQNLTSDFYDNVLVLGEINPVKIYNNNDNLIYLNRSDNEILLEFDNPTDYDISEIVISDLIFPANEITKIEQNVFSVPWNGSYEPTKSLTLTSFTYGVAGEAQSTKEVSGYTTTFTSVHSDVRKTISTIEELQNLKNGYVYELAHDLDFSKKSWNPYSFNGVIYGNGFEIKNLALVFENESTSGQRYGLFTSFNGLIDGLTIENIYASIKTQGIVRFGALSGEFYGAINNCSVTGTINVDSEGGSNVGGLVGSSFFSSSLTITNSYNTGDVSGNNYVGGLVGSSFSDSSLTITNSYNTGDVSGDYGVGGLVGSSESSLTITNSYNTGDVSGNNYVGGFVGSSAYSFTITNSYNTGDVSGGAYVGGFVGSSSLTITNSYNTGDVSGGSNVGGFVGSFSSSLTITNSYNTGDVSGNNYVGGLVGSSFSDSSLTITNSYNTGDVSGDSNVGGFVGSFSSSSLTITNSYNSGLIFIRGNIAEGSEYGEIYIESSLVDSQFFSVTLGWDDNIWNLENVNIGLGIYPTLKN